VIIAPKKGIGLLNKACKIGIVKAKVFPDPVSASAIISLPFKEYGKV